MEHQISLRQCGYKMGNNEQERQQALVNAVQTYNKDIVIQRLNQILVNKNYENQTIQDIAFVKNMQNKDQDIKYIQNIIQEEIQDRNEIVNIAIQSVEYINQKLRIAVEQKNIQVIKALVDSLHTMINMM